MMQQIINYFPDDKPISSICVVEYSTKCPTGFTIVSRTHDTDADADLWRGFTFFGNKITRYLCISKTGGIDNYIVEDIAIIGEKEMPPDGYGLITKTMDTDTKAWKKRQICFKLTRRNLAMTAVTDIILLSKTKKAPEGFCLAGDINGLAVCFKTVHDLGQHNNNPPPSLGYNLNPNGAPTPPQKSNGMYPEMPSPSGDYVNLLRPMRPAPIPPLSSLPTNSSCSPPVSKSPIPSTSSYATLKLHEGLEGVPFILHPALELIATKGASFGSIPVIKKKTIEELDREYYYDFKLENETT